MGLGICLPVVKSLVNWICSSDKAAACCIQKCLAVYQVLAVAIKDQDRKALLGSLFGGLLFQEPDDIQYLWIHCHVGFPLWSNWCYERELWPSSWWRLKKIDIWNQQEPSVCLAMPLVCKFAILKMLLLDLGMLFRVHLRSIFQEEPCHQLCVSQ